ncbi:MULTISPECIES: hypothetical protein [unclassified Microcoleus]|uniref:hypothetical protein n=1 Tax=unclassified Microcoleus TaxID=2642155 RepID=UPI002FD0B6DD
MIEYFYSIYALLVSSVFVATCAFIFWICGRVRKGWLSAFLWAPVAILVFPLIFSSLQCFLVVIVAQGHFSRVLKDPGGAFALSTELGVEAAVLSVLAAVLIYPVMFLIRSKRVALAS